MILLGANLTEFEEQTRNKQIIVFGAGVCFGDLLRQCEEYGIHNRIVYAVDNNRKIWGEYRFFRNNKYEIKSIDSLNNIDVDNTVILIAGQYFYEILTQLDKIPSLDRVKAYIFPLIQFETKNKVDFNIDKSGEMKIPKKIHYFWFGGAPFPEKVKRCMESWRKFCPDYEIIQWDESNYDVNKIPYIQQAYQTKSYAFVSDYARLDIIYNQGGIYLDTDVELVRNLDDLLYLDAYCGFYQHGTRINTGAGFGAKAGFPIIKEWLEDYKNKQFIKDDLSFDTTPCTVHQTNVLKVHKDFKPNGKLQIIDQMVCFPYEYFEPMHDFLRTLNRTDNTYSIHWGTVLWGENIHNKWKSAREDNNSIINELYARIKKEG